jgi:pseudaminic acid biosynthesis-associated methylase
VSNIELWEGSFGDEYVVRNDADFTPRREFFLDLFGRYPIDSILEVGCNNGMNLDIISETLMSANNAWGCDVNQKALNLLHTRHKELNAVWCSGYELPFKDYFFDCVMTCGVLIHQRPQEVESMMQEIMRVSSKYVLCMEYANDQFEEIPYRGNPEALFKGPYGSIYQNRYGMKLKETGFLDSSKGFDRITYWMLARY